MPKLNPGPGRRRGHPEADAPDVPGCAIEPAVLCEIYRALSDERIDYNVRKWDTVRTAALFELGILAAAGGLLSRTSVSRASCDVAAGVLVLASSLLWWWARANTRREAGLQYTTEFSMYQIERLLGLHRELCESESWLVDHRHIFGEKHLQPRYGTGDAEQVKDLSSWLAAKKANHSFTGSLDALFASFFVASVGFAIVLVLLGSSSPSPPTAGAAGLNRPVGSPTSSLERPAGAPAAPAGRRRSSSSPSAR